MAKTPEAAPRTPAALQEHLKKCRNLPTLSSVAREILELGQADDIGTAEVAAALRTDPALTAKLLKTANSAYFNTGGEVLTVDRAVAVIGVNVSLSLALGFSCISALRARASGGFDHAAYWRRSALIAVAARAIGDAEASLSGSGDCFVPGLLQDIGMLILSETVPEFYRPLVREAAGDHDRLRELEREAFGMDHAAVGAWMLERWNLPRSLWSAVALSHQTEPCSEADLEPLVRTAWMAGLVADIWCRTDTATATEAARSGWLARFGPTLDAFREVLDQVAEGIAAVTASLEIEIEGQEEIDRMLDLAREALISLNLRSMSLAEDFRQKATTDALTGLGNRGSFDEELRTRHERSRERRSSLSVVIFDIDYFKRVNDTYGHAAGDAVLAWLAEKLRSTVRASDFVARYGGEEFVVILEGAGEAAAQAMAERARRAVAAEPCPLPGGSVEITISAGCATARFDPRGPTMSQLLGAADRCLYAAKAGGRNRVEGVTVTEVEDAAAA